MSADVAAVTSFYGRWARLYDALATRLPLVGALRAAAADALALDRGDTVVDLGCGTGAALPYLRERVGPSGTVVGVDLTGGMLERARQRVASEGWDNVHLLRGDAADPPLAGPVDGVHAAFLVGMFADPAPAVDRWCDLLAPGGRVVLLDLARSDRRAAAPVNAALAAATVLSTPPTWKLRYERDLDGTLTERVRAARAALAARGPTDERRRLLGLIRLTAGTPGADGPTSVDAQR
jgi:phosphatidylethanolamine/phosphatidyl-N-methylethanolamine N-methyltransferase